MSTVLVTGASGSLGQRVVELVATTAGVDRVLGIDLVPGTAADPRVEHRLLDLAHPPGGDVDRLAAAFDGASAVIHLAWSHSTPPNAPPDGPASGRPHGPASGRPHGPASGRSANLISVGHVLEAASRAGVGRLVHVSSATVYGAWPDNPVPLPEDAAIRPNPGFAFAAEKAEAERMVAEWADDHPDAAVAVLRPAVTVGSPGPALYRALAGTGSPRSGDTGRPMQFLHVEDLATAVILAWGSALRGVYNVAPDGWIGEDAARTLAGGLGRVILPRRLARAVSTVGWQVLRAGTPRQALPYALHPWVIANDRLRAAGWAPQHTNEEALVSADERPRWSELPPSRRQGMILAVGAASVAAGGAATVAAGAAIAARVRRRRSARA